MGSEVAALVQNDVLPDPLVAPFVLATRQRVVRLEVVRLGTDADEVGVAAASESQGGKYSLAGDWKVAHLVQEWQEQATLGGKRAANEFGVRWEFGVTPLSLTGSGASSVSSFAFALRLLVSVARVPRSSSNA